jgi:hypothetical protein
MHWKERYQKTLNLWPYMVPLALVYFAEYAMQVGTHAGPGIEEYAQDKLLVLLSG